MLRKFIAFFLALSSAIFGSNSAFTVSDPQRYTVAVAEQSSYILSLFQPGGSVPMTVPDAVDPALASLNLPDCGEIPGSVYKSWKTAKICPYFSCIAVTGLIEACPDAAKLAAERYINWHFAHLNTADTDYSGIDGTIYDYKIFVNPLDKTELVCLPIAEIYSDKSLAYDSTDSYAAMFLKLLATYFAAYPKSDFLSERQSDTDRVISSICATYLPSLGLTYAKPEYKFCYLMDNCEAYEGLVSACKLYSGLYKNESRSAEIAALANSIRNGIQKNMYSSISGAYYSSVTESGAKSSSVMPWALENLYPDGTAQLLPIICGIIDSRSFRARYLYERFNLNFGTEEDGKSWHALSVGALFPWAVIVRAAVIMNDSARTEKFFDSVSSRYGSSGFKYPYYCAEAGQMLSAAAMINQ